jgi:hypothetical protein
LSIGGWGVYSGGTLEVNLENAESIWRTGRLVLRSGDGGQGWREDKKAWIPNP